MGKNPTTVEKIQDYYLLSITYLESAKISLEKELVEPAMFSAIHALELGLKAALLTKTDESWKTHNIGGQFGKYFRDTLGDTVCQRINMILSKYNLPRYPSEKALDVDEVEDDISFIEDVLEHGIKNIL